MIMDEWICVKSMIVNEELDVFNGNNTIIKEVNY